MEKLWHKTGAEKERIHLDKMEQRKNEYICISERESGLTVDSVPDARVEVLGKPDDDNVTEHNKKVWSDLIKSTP